jgi:hypothetical protein
MESQFKRFLVLTGFLNILGGLVSIIWFRKFFEVFYFIRYQKEINGALLLNHILFFAFVIIMGFGLIKASASVNQEKLFVQISAFSMIYTSLTWIASVLKDHNSSLLFIPSFIEGIIGFYFLYSLKKQNLNE